MLRVGEVAIMDEERQCTVVVGLVLRLGEQEVC